MTRLALIFPFFAACWSPASGTYLFESTGGEDDCESTDSGGSGSDEPYEVEITVADGGDAVRLSTWNPPEGEPKVCPLDGNVFTCSMTAEYDLRPSLAAVMSSFLEIQGGWTSAGEMKGQTTFSNTCEGADCQTAFGASLCSGDSTWTATLQE